MEGLTLLAFCCVLVGCIILHGSLVAALAVGLFIFLSYGRAKGHSLRALCGMCLSGVRSARNILINVLLIGILTALWRASGAIPVIVSWASRLIRPSDYLLMTFLYTYILTVNDRCLRILCVFFYVHSIASHCPLPDDDPPFQR